MDLATTVFDTGLAPDVILAAAFGTGPGTGGVYAYGVGAPPSTTPTLFASIANPLGLGVDPSNGNVYIGANGGTSIEEFGPSGGASIATIASSADIDALTVDTAGDVFTVDNMSGDIDEYLAGGGETTYSNGPVDGAENYGIAFDNAGDLYVTYFDGGGGGGIDLITPNGNVSNFYTSASTLPTSLAYDPDSGELFFTYLSSGNGSGGGIGVLSAGTGGTVSQSESTYATLTQGDIYAVGAVAPEPGTIALLLGGLACLPLLRRRNNKG